MFCQFCNKEIPDGSLVCGFCGKELNEPLLAENSNSDVSQDYADFDQPEINTERLKKAAIPIKSSDMMSLEQLAKKRRPLSTLNFVLMHLVLLINPINIILLFMWAFRKNTNANRQAYARSILIIYGTLIILLAISILILFCMGFDFEYYHKIAKKLIENFRETLRG